MCPSPRSATPRPACSGRWPERHAPSGSNFSPEGNRPEQLTCRQADALIVFGLGQGLAAQYRPQVLAVALDRALAHHGLDDELGLEVSELRASGERARRRIPDTADQLTPQERQVVALVAEGVTNREAAAALFVSPKTIETHPSHIYRKLGLRSRAQLARRLPTADATRLRPSGDQGFS
jgi:DNA-binding NarL/FixJ family response regulator